MLEMPFVSRSLFLCWNTRSAGIKLANKQMNILWYPEQLAFINPNAVTFIKLIPVYPELANLFFNANIVQLLFYTMVLIIPVSSVFVYEALTISFSYVYFSSASNHDYGSYPVENNLWSNSQICSSAMNKAYIYSMLIVLLKVLW